MAMKRAAGGQTQASPPPPTTAPSTATSSTDPRPPTTSTTTTDQPPTKSLRSATPKPSPHSPDPVVQGPCAGSGASVGWGIERDYEVDWVKHFAQELPDNRPTGHYFTDWQAHFALDDDTQKTPDANDTPPPSPPLPPPTAAPTTAPPTAPTTELTEPKAEAKAPILQLPPGMKPPPPPSQPHPDDIVPAKAQPRASSPAGSVVAASETTASEVVNPEWAAAFRTVPGYPMMKMGPQIPAKPPPRPKGIECTPPVFTKPWTTRVDRWQTSEQLWRTDTPEGRAATAR